MQSPHRQPRRYNRVTGIMKYLRNFWNNSWTQLSQTSGRMSENRYGVIRRVNKNDIKETKRVPSGENIVVDPVMVATSGSRLISETAIDTLKTQLLPMATVITPNIPEAEVLAEMEIRSEDDMVEAAKKIHEMYHCAVLCKGGHSLNDANDLLYQDGETTWFHGKRINNPNTH